jgi:N-acetylglucosamine-6-sulfatase
MTNIQKYKHCLVKAVAALGAILALIAPAEADEFRRPNIVYIFSDDHALQAITAYGSRYAEHTSTPNIDRLAREGALFLQSFCANSICGPSRASVLTGKHSHKNGFIDNSSRFDADQPTFPKYLQQAGYQTAVIGKWHLHTTPTGFDHFEILPGQGSYVNPDFIQMDGSTKRFEGYVTDIIMDKSLEWLANQRDKSKPFILMSQHKAPHRNWVPAPRHYQLFHDVELPEPETLFDDYSNRSEALQKQAMSIAHHFFWGWDMFLHGKPTDPRFMGGLANGEYARMTDEQKAVFDEAYGPENQELLDALAAGQMDDESLTRWKYQRYIKNYLGTIRAVDENVGRILEYLDEAGLADNTIVIYSSDQGFYLGEHGWYDKRWMFEESLAMPFLIRWPGVVQPGTRVDAMIQNIDHAPTFLEVAGVKVPDDIQGRSLVPILKNKGQAPDDWREAIFYYYSGEGTHRVAAHNGVRTDRYKLFYLPGTDEWQMFDLKEDPLEMLSVHEHPEYAGVRKKMERIYHELRTKYEVEWDGPGGE